MESQKLKYGSVDLNMDTIGGKDMTRERQMVRLSGFLGFCVLFLFTVLKE